MRKPQPREGNYFVRGREGVWPRVFGVPAAELDSVVATDTQETLLPSVVRLSWLPFQLCRLVGVGPFVSCGM